MAALNSGVPVLNHDTVLGLDRGDKHFGSLGSSLCVQVLSAVTALMRFTALDKKVTIIEGSGTGFVFPGTQVVGLPESYQIPKCTLYVH